MLFVPERAYEDGVVEHSEMLALIAVHSTTWMLHQKENVPGDEWLRFSGGDFFPGSKWTPGNDELNVPGDEWMPDELSELEVLFHPGEQQSSDLLENMDFSDYKIPWPSADETKNIEITKEKAALAVPASQLLNINIKLNVNLAEVLYEEEIVIDYPTERGSKIPVNLSDGLMPYPGSEGLIHLVSGENFFPENLNFQVVLLLRMGN
jgi:hypothetical protein